MSFVCNVSILITNQQGLPKMATNQELKSGLLRKLSAVKARKKKLILQQEAELKYLSLNVAGLIQVWKNIICFLLFLSSSKCISEGSGDSCNNEEFLQFNLDGEKNLIRLIALMYCDGT